MLKEDVSAKVEPVGGQNMSNQTYLIKGAGGGMGDAAEGAIGAVFRSVGGVVPGAEWGWGFSPSVAGPRRRSYFTPLQVGRGLTVIRGGCRPGWQARVPIIRTERECQRAGVREP